MQGSVKADTTENKVESYVQFDRLKKKVLKIMQYY